MYHEAINETATESFTDSNETDYTVDTFPEDTTQKDVKSKPSTTPSQETRKSFTKSKSIMDDMKTTDASSYKEPPRTKAYTVPTPNQGAYYGTTTTSSTTSDDDKYNQNNDNKQDSNSINNEKKQNKKNNLTEITNKLNKKIAYDQKKRSKETLAQQLQRKRFSISRIYAAPVERVLEKYNHEDTNLYDVLDVRFDVSDQELRKAYRNIALLIHPGKILLYIHILYYIVWYYNTIFNVYFIYLYYIYIHIPVYLTYFILLFSRYLTYIYNTLLLHR